MIISLLRSIQTNINSLDKVKDKEKVCELRILRDTYLEYYISKRSSTDAFTSLTAHYLP